MKRKIFSIRHVTMKATTCYVLLATLLFVATEAQSAPLATTNNSNVATSSNDNQSSNKHLPHLSPKNSQDGIIALANDMPILKSELVAAVQQIRAQIQASGSPQPSAQQLNNEVLNQLILRKLQLNLIERMGLRPNSEVINKQLQAIAQSQGLNSVAQLQQRMDATNKGSYATLRQQITEEVLLKALQQRQIVGRVHISEQDIDAFLDSPEAKRLQTDEYHTIHIRIPYIDAYSRISQAQKDEALAVAQKVRQALLTTDDVNVVFNDIENDQSINYPINIQGGDVGFHPASGLPTELSGYITKLDIGDVTAPLITPEGINVIKLLDKRGGKSMTIPQWYTRHILVKTDDSQSDELAQQKINDIYSQLQRGADFQSLAATYSEDAGSAAQKGNLDWVSEGQMVPEFETTMKNTPAGTFSAPFKSPFGWHIVQVVETRNNDVSEQYQRNMAREVLFQRLAPQAQEDWLQELRANAYVQVFN